MTFTLSLLSTKKHTLSFNNSQREYLLHPPPSYKNGDKFPLVIALHGYTDNPRIMEFYTGLSRKADKEKFIVVYPYGTKNNQDKNLSWNGGSCCGNGVTNDIDDVGFINSLTDELVKKYKVDPQKIYLVGFSNGALLTYRIISETPERYQAAAIVSGSIGGKVYKKLPEFNIKDPKSPISLLAIHGMTDTRIPFDGGLNKVGNGSFKSFKEATELWMNVNGCSGEVMKEDEIVKIQKFEKCDKDLELYSVKNAGHVWGGSLLDYKNLIGRNSFPATDIILEFFNLSDAKKVRN